MNAHTLLVGGIHWYSYFLEAVSHSLEKVQTDLSLTQFIIAWSSDSQTLTRSKILWGLLKQIFESHSKFLIQFVLGGGKAEFACFQSSQMMVILLIQGPYFENH